MLSVSLIFASLAFGQGKGKGNAGGNGRGGQNSGHQGGNENQGRGKHAERSFPQAQNQPDFRGRGNGNGKQVERYQRSSGPVVIRQERSSRVEFIGPPVQQPRGRGDENRGRGQEKRQRREFERQDRQARTRQKEWNDDRRWRNGRRDGDDDDDRRSRTGRRNDNDDNRRYERYRSFPQYVVPRAWPNNYGAYRSAEVHERNDRRKAEKQARKAWDRDYDRNSRYYNNAPYYVDQNYYGYNDDWRDRLLRSVIGNVFNGGDSYYFVNQSYVPRTTYRQGYQPSYYEPTFYSPYADDRYQYSTAYVDNPYYEDDIVNSLGFGDSGFGGVVSRIFSELLAVGYDDGYQAGQYARSQGYRNDQAYYDPYDPNVYNDVAFEDVDYNPYSCFAENRRYMSEGYELGYQDGLRAAGGRDEFGNGSLDLVSVLLGNIL